MLNPLPRVAVGLAAYNGMRYLKQQVDSILCQKGVALTIFVSVDLSTDGTEAWFHHLAEHEPRVRVLPATPAFGSAAANFLRLLRDVDLSGFDYFSFADQDDIWVTRKLLCAHQQMTAMHADGYSSNVTAFWPKGRQQLINKAQPQRRWDHLFEAAGPGCTYVLRHGLAKSLQQLASARQAELGALNYHDWFVYAFARIHGHRWVIDPQPGVLYRQHASNQVGANSGLKAFLRRAIKVHSGEAFSQAVLIARVAGLAADHPVMQRFIQGRAGALRLALMAGQCRRRRVDQVYFFFSCLIATLSRP